MRMHTGTLMLFSALWLRCSRLASAEGHFPPPPTPSAKRNVTVSGQSSGGSMAMQHLFAFSASVEGAGIAAGSAYGCGAFRKGHYPKGHCYWGGSDVQQLIGYVNDHFKQGLIDDPKNLRTTPVILFNGKSDWVVYPKTMREAAQQLRAFVDQPYLETRFDTQASHVWSLDHGSCSCGDCSWYGHGLCCDVNNCGYDMSGDMFKRFYGSVRARTTARESFSWIPQHKYLPAPSRSWSSAHVEEWAIAYVPSGCKQDVASCRIHVNYHGCIADKWPKRRLWVSNLDLNEYGEANNIIILYPQALGDHSVGVGCWNWGWASDDSFFDSRKSVQLQMVTNMVEDFPSALASAQELPLDEGPPALSHNKESAHVAGSFDGEAVFI